MLQAAEEAYSDSLAGSTSNAVVWANRSAARLALGKAELALLDARLARTVDPAYAKVCSLLGVPRSGTFKPSTRFELHGLDEQPSHSSAH